MERRKFLKYAAAIAGTAMATNIISCKETNSLQRKTPLLPISQVSRRLAIAMWDFSWILRHHRYGEFGNWDQVLEGLTTRGYNAIRIDSMPQFIVSHPDGTIQEEFRCVKEGWTPSLWGNDFTTTIRPREALLEFLPKCREYGIRVGLASWFLRHGAGREDIFMEEDGLYCAWLETLHFLDSNGLLEGILYVDLLNEYPFWHGYDWLKKELDDRSDIQLFKLKNPEAHVPEFDPARNEKFNPLQKTFYKQFANDLIAKLKEQFPAIDFFVSLDSGMALKDMDLSKFSALDYHIWFAHHGSIPGLSEIGSRDQTQDLKHIYHQLLAYWQENRQELVGWMDARLKTISASAAKQGIPCGNTEGWGPISWYDHPELDWNWVKTSAEICIDLALHHDNYKFLCTSNFTHPQFRGIWNDLEWHQEMTRKIREN
jgi:hypothetical protein